LTHKTCTRKYTLLFSGKLLQLNEILAREEGGKELLILCNSGYNDGLAISI